MAEYIKRDEAIAALDKVRDDQRAFKYATASDFLSARDAIERAVKVLESLPAADVEPVKHGRWVRIGIKGRKGLLIYPCCSVCGVVSAAFRSEWEGLRGPWKFCPHCGERMDEEAKHER